MKFDGFLSGKQETGLNALLVRMYCPVKLKSGRNQVRVAFSEYSDARTLFTILTQ